MTIWLKQFLPDVIELVPPPSAAALSRQLPAERVLVKPVTYSRLRDLGGQLRQVNL